MRHTDMPQADHLEVMRRALRARICPRCSQRPAGSEALGPRRARSCEATCPIFLYLPMLETLAVDLDPQPGAYEHAINERVCQQCTSSSSAGDYCSDRLARTCPLSRYAGSVVQVIENLLRK